MKNTQLLITSSDNIPFSEISKYLGIVDSQIVVGANIFRDVFAGFRDIFGGETKGYKKDIDNMKNAALANIKRKARNKGANAIISLRFDLDEFSGSGKSMFMLNIYGSAVKLKNDQFNIDKKAESGNEFSFKIIEHYRERNRLINKISESDNIISDIDLDSISKFNLWDENVSNEILNLTKSPNYKSSYVSSELKNNLSEIPIQFIEDFIKNNLGNITSYWLDRVYESLADRNWFNYEFLFELLKSENHVARFRALKFCTIQKDYYSLDDIQELNSLSNFLKDDFDSTIPTKTINKMLSKKEIFTCANCKKEHQIEELCECGANKFGLNSLPESPKAISENLSEMALALESANKISTN